MLKSVLQLDLTCEITICKISFNFISWSCSKQKFLPNKDQAVRLLNSSVYQAYSVIIYAVFIKILQ